MVKISSGVRVKKSGFFLPAKRFCRLSSSYFYSFDKRCTTLSPFPSIGVYDHLHHVAVLICLLFKAFTPLILSFSHLDEKTIFPDFTDTSGGSAPIDAFYIIL